MKYKVVKLKKVERLKLGGWVELDYDAYIEVHPGLRFYREAKVQSDSYRSANYNEGEHWKSGIEGFTFSVTDYGKKGPDSFFYGWRVGSPLSNMAPTSSTSFARRTPTSR